MTVLYTDIYDKFGELQVNQLAADVNFDVLNAGYLLVGKRYVILSLDGGASFTSVGASADVVGTVFRASTGSVLPTWGTGGSLQQGYSEQENIETQISEAIIKLESYAQINGHTVDLDVDFQKQFVVYYTMYLLYLINNYDEEGIQERKEALMLLQRYWGGSVYDGENLENQDTKPLLQAHVSVSNTWTVGDLSDWL